jgi:hypothetical protein
MRLGYELHGALDRNAPAEGNKEINIQINIMGNTEGEAPSTISV